MSTLCFREPSGFEAAVASSAAAGRFGEQAEVYSRDGDRCEFGSSPICWCLSNFCEFGFTEIVIRRSNRSSFVTVWSRR
jgi:hypothetical protein